MQDELSFEVKTTRSDRLHLESRDLKGIEPAGYLAALLVDRSVSGPRWCLVSVRRLVAGTVELRELVRREEQAELAARLDKVWSDWLLDTEGWKRLLELGGRELRPRIQWLRRDGTPKSNNSRGSLRSNRVLEALTQLRAHCDSLGHDKGPQIEGHLHQALLEDALSQSGYIILPNPVGVPDVRARKQAAESAADIEDVRGARKRSDGPQIEPTDTLPSLASEVFPSFVAFVEAVVLPRFLEEPGYLRLDGQESGGNRNVAGRFRHDNSTWKVHEDSRYEPLLLAYWSLRFRANAPTFTRHPTKSGERLDLVEELDQLSEASARHLYLYLDER